ncbi:MAG: hypothetical protein MJA32_02705, partial [Proteobacteria bacterium]|nr:hypothetical protein [Pseudomonadota bacterium]
QADLYDWHVDPHALPGAHILTRRVTLRFSIFFRKPGFRERGTAHLDGRRPGPTLSSLNC